MKKVLITGASGFLGSRLALYFNQERYEVIGWNRSLCPGQIHTHCINLLDIKEVESSLKSYKADIIIHCAGSADVGKSVMNPMMDFEGNVTITHNLMFSLHRLGLEESRFVFLSSAGVYGNPISLPIKEDMKLNPLSPYAVHKMMCEDICNYFVNNYGMNIKIARVFSAYGAGLKKQLFWDMYKKYVNTGRLDLFGTGNESRDYIHVDDVVQALFLIATSEDKEIVYNVGNGEEIKIKDIALMFADKIGINRKVISFNGVVREGDPINWRADNSKIVKLGYKKTINIEQGISSYINWASDQIST